MNRLFFVLIMFTFATGIFVITESHAEIMSIVKDPTKSEAALIYDGYSAHQYAVMPFGAKHFFSKTDNPLSLADVSTGRCLMHATYLIKEGESINVSMKFPNDLTWPGMHDYATFFLTKGGNHGYTDNSGNMVTKNTPVVWERLNPVIDSEFVTVEFELKDEMGSIIVNSTSLPVKSDNSSDPQLGDSCPRTPPRMEYDYYDHVFTIEQQKIIAEMKGFTPDTFICVSENSL